MLDPLEERCLLSFGSPSLLAPSSTNAAVAVGDIFGGSLKNGSPILDLVTAPTSGGLDIAQGNGNGSFQTAVPISLSVSTLLPSFSSVKLKDLTGNGWDDIIATDPKDNEVWVFMNNWNNQGIGDFKTSTYSTGLTPMDVAVADLGNGQFDIVTANENGNSVSVLLGKGDGTFQLATNYSVGTQPMAVAIGHFFGNDNTTPLDIVTANYASNSISLLQGNNNDDGTFYPKLNIPITVTLNGQSSASHPRDVAVADFNGDGQDDIVTANDGVPSVTVLLSNVHSGYGQQTYYLSDTQDPPTAVVAADFDGNTKPDIVVSEPSQNSIVLFPGNGDGTFSSQAAYSAGGDTTALAFGNLNGAKSSQGLDLLDLVAVGPSDSQASILLGFGSPSLFDTDPNPNAAVVAIGDIFGGSLNGSPILDVVTAPTSGGLNIARGNGDATFQTAVPISISITTPLPTFSSVKLADLTSNGWDDIIAASSIDNKVWVFLNQKNGTFESPTVYSTGSVCGIADVAVADLGNGHDDIVTANGLSDSVSVLLGNGAGTFGTPQQYTVGHDPVAVAIGHFFGNDNTTPLDIVTANYASNSISLLQGNNNDGTFSQASLKTIPLSLPNGQELYPTAVAVANFNNDGQDDIVTANGNVANGGVPSVTVLLSNTVTETYGQTTTALSDTHDAPTAVVAADFDGDGNADIVVAVPGNQSIGLFSGNGDGTFSSQANYFAGGDATALAFGNLNGAKSLLGLDRLGLVAVGPSDTQPSILLDQMWSTTTTISASLSTITYGSSIILTYSVANGGAPSASQLTGSFQLYVDGTSHGPLIPIPLSTSSATTTIQSLSAGQHVLTVEYLGDVDFLQSLSSPVNVTVNPAPLTITAGNRNWTYGTDVANAGSTFPLSIQDVLGIQDVFTVSFGQLYNGDTVGSVILTTNATLSTSSHYNAGTWPITPSAAIFSSGSSSNYTITYANASTGLTVAPLALYMTGGTADSSKVYDGSTNDPLNPNEIPQFKPGSLLSSKSGTDAVNTPTGSANFANSNVGTNKTVSYNYSISGDDAADYRLIQPPSTTADITKATLVITALDQNPPYGFGGIQYGGTNAALGTTDFTAFVEINNDTTDLVNMYSGDSVTSVTLSTDASLSNSHNYNVALPDAAPWTITPSSPIGKGLSNYTITYDTGTLTISPMDLTVTPLPAYRTYGSDDTSSMFSPVLTGFLKGDGEDTSELSGGLDYSCTDGYNTDSTLMTKDPAQDAVGTYTISITQPNPNDPNYSTLYPNGPLTYKDQNYTLAPTESSGTLISAQLINGTLTIDPAPLTITALPQTQDYGFDGTVNSDGTIILPGTSAALTPGAPSIPYTKFSMISSGNLFNNDSIKSVLLSTDDTISSSSHYNAGTWSLTPSDASGVGLLNYTITYASASTGLTVKPYVLSLNYLDTNGNPIAVTAQDMVYNGDTRDIIDDSTGNPITPVLSTLRFLTDKVTLVQGSVDFADPNVGTNKPVTFKGFSITGADVADYSLNPPPSNLTANITSATLVITAGSQIQPYGFGGKDAGTNASLGTTDFTAQVQIPDPTDPTDPTKDTYIPMYGSDSVTSVTLSTNASDSTSLNYNVALPDAAPWTITPSSPIGSGLSNYAITYDTGTLTISPKDLTITADNKSRSYGDVNPALTYAISGFVPGDFLDSSMLKGSPTITTTAGAQSGAGVYAITITNYGSLTYTNPNDFNYTFVNSIQQLVGGELTVQTVPLTVSLSLGCPV